MPDVYIITEVFVKLNTCYVKLRCVFAKKYSGMHRNAVGELVAKEALYKIWKL